MQFCSSRRPMGWEGAAQEGLSRDGDSWGHSRQGQLLGWSSSRGLTVRGLSPPCAPCPQVPSCHHPPPPAPLARVGHTHTHKHTRPAQPYHELDVAVVDGEGPGEVGPALQDEELVALVACSSLRTAQGQVHLCDHGTAKPGHAPPNQPPLPADPITHLGMGSSACGTPQSLPKHLQVCPATRATTCPIICTTTCPVTLPLPAPRNTWARAAGG